MELNPLMYFGFVAILIFVIGIYLWFFSKGKQINPFEYLLKPPVKSGNRLIYMGKNGVHYDSRIEDIKVYNGGIGDIKLENGIKLVGVGLEDHIQLPKVWNNIASDEGIVYCCVDGINRITEWNPVKMENYLELEESWKLSESEKIKDSLLEEAEFTDKRRLQATKAMMGNILPGEEGYSNE